MKTTQTPHDDFAPDASPWALMYRGAQRLRVSRRRSFTLADLALALPEFGKRRAVGMRHEYGLRWWTYSRLYDECLRAAEALRSLGLAPGMRVVFWIDNQPAFVAALLGAFAAGLVPVLVDARQPRGFVERVTRDAGATLVIYDPNLAPGAAPDDWVALPSLRARCGRDPLPPSPGVVAPDDTAVVIYSSGTTATPKGVPLSHRRLLQQVEAFQGWGRVLQVLPLRLLVTVPITHIQGLLLGVLVPLAFGMGAIFLRSCLPHQVATVLRDNRVALLLTVPRTLFELRQHVERRLGKPAYGETRGAPRRRVRRVLGRTLRAIFVGGASLPAPTEAFFRAAGLLVFEGYGTTEVGGIISIRGPLSPRAGGGRLLPHQRVSIDPNGEVLVQTLGATATTAITPASPLHTGDLGRLDADGRLEILSRADDVIVNAEGDNIYPSDVEAVALELPQVTDCAVVGVASATGTEVHAVLVLREAAASPGLVVQEINARLHPHQRIRSFSVSNTPLPRNSLGKLPRRAIRSRVANASDGAAGPPETACRITLREVLETQDSRARLEALATYVCQGSPLGSAANGTTSDDLRIASDLGLSSLDFADLLGRLEDARGERLTAASIHPDSTVAELRSWLTQPAPGPERQLQARTIPLAEPSFTQSIWARCARRGINRAARRLWEAMNARVEARWCGTGTLPRCVIVATAPHRHWLDAFAVQSCLPEHVANRLAIVTNRDFARCFAADPGTPLRARVYLGAAYYAVLPSLYRFSIWSDHRPSRVGLLEVGKMLDERRSQLIFPGGLGPWEDVARRPAPGFARMAIESGTPVLPVYIAGTDRVAFAFERPRARVQVYFGRLLEPPAADGLDELIAQFVAETERLRRLAELESI